MKLIFYFAPGRVARKCAANLHSESRESAAASLWLMDEVIPLNAVPQHQRGGLTGYLFLKVFASVLGLALATVTVLMAREDARARARSAVQTAESLQLRDLLLRHATSARELWEKHTPIEVRKQQQAAMLEEFRAAENELRLQQNFAAGEAPGFSTGLAGSVAPDAAQPAQGAALLASEPTGLLSDDKIHRRARQAPEDPAH